MTSDNETIKLSSDALRGTLAASLAGGGSHFDENDVQLLKFHGSYQQDDRDQRRARRAEGLEKEYRFMIRSRIPGGALTSPQYLAHDELAGRYGNGSLRLTTRQGIQLHGVIKRDLRPTIAHINETLLSTLAACGDVNRNVMTCPAPARTPAHEQVRAYARALAVHLAPRSRAYHEIWLGAEKLAQKDEEPIYGETYLPRKFKIGIAPPQDNCIDVYTQDLGFVAVFDGDALQGFTVLAGGGMGSTHGKAQTYPRLATPLGFVKPSGVFAVAEAVVTVHRDYGDRENRKHARLKYVVEERGIEWVRAEVERRSGLRLDDPHAVQFEQSEDHLGWHRQTDGRWFLGVHVANGRVADGATANARSAFREIAERYAPALRITGQQNLLFIDVASEDRGAIERLLRDRGVESDPAALGILRYAMACPALPTCGLAVAEAERVLPSVLDAVDRELSDLGLGHEALSVRMTGCPNGCARPRMGDIGIIGRSLDLYDVYVGGDALNTRLNALYAQGVKRDAIAAALRPALQRWEAERVDGERFGDFTQRIASR